jgi:hypothetical protein
MDCRIKSGNDDKSEGRGRDATPLAGPYFAMRRASISRSCAPMRCWKGRMKIGHGGNSMRSPFARIAKRSVRAGGNMVSQVVVSVAAAVCVGLITNAYFEQPAAVEAPIQAVDPATANSATDDLSRVVIGATDDAYRDIAPSRPLTPAAAQSPIRNVEVAPLPVAAASFAEAVLPPLASQIVADLPVHDATANNAEIFPGVPSEGALTELLREPGAAASPEGKRRRFLGLPLPYFVPTAGDIMQSASAAGGKIVSLVER